MRRYFKRNGVPCLVTIDHQVSTTPRRRLGIVYDGMTARVGSYQCDNLVIASATHLQEHHVYGLHTTDVMRFL